MPDLPGYGLSKPTEKHDKLTVGLAVLTALKSLLNSTSRIPVILIGHDRGGRVSHRLTVSKSDVTSLGFDLLATCVIDIVPTKIQWAAFSNPRSSVAYWHWSFLATEIAPTMIAALGGGKYCVDIGLRRIAGRSSKGRESMESGDSMAVYGAAFDNPEVVKATCGDYAAGATVDVDAQDEDQKAGR